MMILVLKELVTMHKNIKLQLTIVPYLRQMCGVVGYEYEEVDYPIHLESFLEAMRLHTESWMTNKLDK